ncbi:MAG: DUF2794 domain-containing protein [Micropepsaceae bacterium]
MDDTANIVDLRGTGRSLPRTDDQGAASSAGRQPVTAFDRLELNAILNIYGRMVAAGEWRDYAIDWLRDSAIFSVFRRASEMPLYRIEKHPKLRAKQGAYVVLGAGGQVLKRGHDLKQVLRVFDAKLIKAVEA